MADMRVDGHDADFNEGIFPMMQGMMMNLLSKDVLYPALDELRTKVNYLLYFLLHIIYGICGEARLLSPLVEFYLVILVLV